MLVKQFKEVQFMFRNLSGNNLPATFSFFKQKMVGNKGMSLIEILVAVFIISTALSSVLGLTSFSLNAVSFTKQSYEANILAQGLIEQVRNFRDQTKWNINGLETLTNGLDYYASKTGSPEEWQMIQGTETINGFTKKIVFEEVERDGSANIVENGGIIDPNTKKITATILWQERNKTHQIELITYLTNWKQ